MQVDPPGRHKRSCLKPNAEVIVTTLILGFRTRRMNSTLGMSTYSKLLGSVLLGTYYSLRGRKYGAHRRFLEESQWWTPERLELFQWQELRKLLAYCLQNVPYYQRKYAGINLEDVRSVRDFRNLPPLSRAEVNENREDLCNPRGDDRLIPHATGGSSGTPARFYMNVDSFDWRLAATERAYSWSGYRIGDRALFLWGAPATRLSLFHATKLKAYHLVRRELLVNTFRHDGCLWETILQKLRRFRPLFIVGYVSSLESFAEHLLARRERVDGIKAVLSAAEPVTERTRDLVQAAFEAPLFNTYGSREFMSVAVECDRHEGLHVNAENILVETEGDGRGPSELLITDLHNYGTPLIRYRIGDAGSLATGQCGCGRGLPRIRAIEGRVADLLRLPSGRVVSGLIFPHVVKEFPQIREFQVEQRSPEAIVLRVVLNSPLTPPDVDRLHRAITRIIGEDINCEVADVPSIPRLPSGKRRVSIGLPS
jgi:phenylacetate-CoA ligase